MRDLRKPGPGLRPGLRPNELGPSASRTASRIEVVGTQSGSLANDVEMTTPSPSEGAGEQTPAATPKSPRRPPASPASIRRRVLRWVREAWWGGLSTRQIRRHFPGRDDPQVPAALEDLEREGLVRSEIVKPRGQQGKRWYPVQQDE